MIITLLIFLFSLVDGLWINVLLFNLNNVLSNAQNWSHCERIPIPVLSRLTLPVLRIDRWIRVFITELNIRIVGLVLRSESSARVERILCAKPEPRLTVLSVTLVLVQSSLSPYHWGLGSTFLSSVSQEYNQIFFNVFKCLFNSSIDKCLEILSENFNNNSLCIEDHYWKAKAFDSSLSCVSYLELESEH